MSGKEQFVKLPRDLLESAAWRAQSINCRRFVDFLMAEHMRNGGRANGNLKAPRRQLWAFGIGPHFVGPIIAEAETLGLVDATRGNRRIASTYALTWLPLHNGAAPSNRWRECDGIAETIIGGRKEAKTRSVLSAKQHSRVNAKQHSKDPVMSAKQHSKGAEKCSAKQHSLLRYSYQEDDVVLEEEGVGASSGIDSVCDHPDRDPWSAPTAGQADDSADGAHATDGGYSDRAPWRERYSARLARWTGSRLRSEVEALAYSDLMLEWHRSHGSQPEEGHCAGCGEALGTGSLFVDGDGTSVHSVEAHNIDCIIAYGARWRGAAIAGLQALGLEPPEGFEL